MDVLKAKESFFDERVKSILQQAKAQGASQAEVALTAGTGFSLNVRHGAIETIEHHDDQNLSLTVYFGKQKGSASTTDLSTQSLEETLAAAVHIAKFTLPDDCSGLPDADTLAKTWPDVDIYHPWNISVEAAIDLATELEAYALSNKEISNSEGAGFNTYQGLNVYGSSEDFFAATYATHHGLNIGLIVGSGDQMQRDYSYTEARDYRDLWDPEQVATDALSRTLRRLHPQKIATGNVPVIFEAPIAAGLISHYLKAISGAALYRRSSFLLDSLGTQIFPDWFSLYDDPFIPKALGSAPFDAEGVAIHPKYLVEQGKVLTYLLSTYTGRKLGMKTTGNAGGIYNVKAAFDQNLSLQDLISKMDRGLFVTEVMGQGVNLVTGDYSRGASGFWVEDGKIQFPVQEITIAGNLKTMFQDLLAVSHDIETRGRIHTGSMLIKNMMVAGH